jgi:hypothetical protein
MNYDKDILRAGQIWQHYKNKDYRIIALSRDTTTLEWYVVYEALYENETSQIWHRNVDEFLGSIEIDGKSMHRFTKREI